MTDTVFREATVRDVPDLFRVRTSVTENLMTMGQLAQRGITTSSIAAALSSDARGWVAERQGTVVAFSLADRASGTILALFVLPAFGGQGMGTSLLDLALEWLWECGLDRAWLTTAPGTRAARFYEARGWVAASGLTADGEMHFEIEAPRSPA